MECNAESFDAGRGGSFLAIDWEPTALHLRYQTSQERVRRSIYWQMSQERVGEHLLSDITGKGEKEYLLPNITGKSWGSVYHQTSQERVRSIYC